MLLFVVCFIWGKRQTWFLLLTCLRVMRLGCIVVWIELGDSRLGNGYIVAWIQLGDSRLGNGCIVVWNQLGDSRLGGNVY